MSIHLKTFSLAQANELIPTLRISIQIIRVRYHAYHYLNRRLKDFYEENKNNIKSIEKDDFQKTKKFYEIVKKDLDHKVQDVFDLGVILQDPLKGVVDFMSLKDGSTVFLSWQFSEAEIYYWHGLEDAFSSRKRIHPMDQFSDE